MKQIHSSFTSILRGGEEEEEGMVAHTLNFSILRQRQVDLYNSQSYIMRPCVNNKTNT